MRSMFVDDTFSCGRSMATAGCTSILRSITGGNIDRMKYLQIHAFYPLRAMRSVFYGILQA